MNDNGFGDSVGTRLARAPYMLADCYGITIEY